LEERTTNMKIIRTSFFVGTLALGSIFGCASDATQADSEAALEVQSEGMRPFLSVSLDQGRSVDFYEASPGALAITSRGPVGTLPVDREYDMTGSPVEIFERLRPGTPAPQVLVEAQLRNERLKAASPLHESSATEEPAEPDVDPISDETEDVVPKDAFHTFWRDSVCNVTDVMLYDAFIDSNACPLHKTGNDSWLRGRRMEIRSGCFAFDGNISCKLRWKAVGSTSYTTLWDVQVEQGFYILNHTTSTPSARDSDWEFSVYNASGNGYHAVVTTSKNTCAAGCSPSQATGGCLCGVPG
jgi:hypothetical protein